MFAYQSIQLDSPPIRCSRESRTQRIEIAVMTHLADLARCRFLFIDHDDWVAAHLYDHGLVVDSPAHTKAFIEQQAPRLLTGSGRLYAAYLDGRPVGVLVLSEVAEGTAEVTRLFVNALARRRGVARCLLERMIQDARSLGYRTLQARVLPFMMDARRLYETAGFNRQQQLDELTTLMECAPAGIDHSGTRMA